MRVVALAVGLLATSIARAEDVSIPVDVVADRFVPKARHSDGALVRSFTDTGGGLCFVYADGVGNAVRARSRDRRREGDHDAVGEPHDAVDYPKQRALFERP